MKTNLKKIICLILVIVMTAVPLATTASAEDAPIFSDVPEDHWAYFYIQQCCERNILNGYPVTDDSSLPEFKPDGNVRVGELLKIACLMVWPDYEYTPIEGQKHWAEPYQQSMKIGLTYFWLMKPEELQREAIRGEAAVVIAIISFFLNRKLGFEKGNEYIKDFIDADSVEDETIINCANTLVKWGLMEGFPDGTLGLEKNLTRAQVSKLVYVALHDYANYWYT